MFNYCPPVLLEDLQSETFPDGKRYYTLADGTKLPSVTTVLGAQNGDLAHRIVVGAGNAELCAAHSARDRGAEVLVLQFPQ